MKTLLRQLGWIGCIVAIHGAHGAVPRTLNGEDGAKLVREALRLPLENRIQALRSQGARTHEKLNQMAFDRQETLQVRWRALTSLPHLDQELGKVALEKALASDEWYLRNAATLALPALPRTIAVDWSARLLSDPALVVRTAAAQNLLKLNAKEKEYLLWEKLSSPENFRGGESLWVRRHIARALSEFARPGTESKFISLLQDRDSRLHPFAIRGLERLTGQRLSKVKEPMKESRGRWLAWWQERKSAQN
jgi:HEAT repeat protein